MRDDCYYLEDGFWALVENGKVRIGITDYLQRTLGDAAFVELPKKGLETERGGEIGALETAKASIPIVSPSPEQLRRLMAPLMNDLNW